jgi:mannosyl-3-phosphoglycerate phosphatase family protein
MNKTGHKLIFTDLDGTLLDQDDASWTPAQPALQEALALGIPVIPCSSRSFNECRALHQQMGLRGPIVFENGAGVALPQNQFRRPLVPPSDESEGYWLCRVAQPYAYVREILQKLRQKQHYLFRGMGDMSPNEIQQYTGRDATMAQFAKQRRHSEALFWLDNAKSFDIFVKDLESQGLRLTRGSHFIHVGSPCDKGQAVRWLTGVYQKLLGTRPQVIILGDSANDLPMLQAADTAVVIRRPHAMPLQYRPRDAQQQLLVSEAAGPAGWNQIMHRLLEKTALQA